MRCRESPQNTLVSQHRPLFGNHRHLHHQRREVPRRIRLFAPVSLRKNRSGNLLVHKSRVHTIDTCNHLLVRGSHRIPLLPFLSSASGVRSKRPGKRSQRNPCKGKQRTGRFRNHRTHAKMRGHRTSAQCPSHTAERLATCFLTIKKHPQAESRTSPQPGP